MRTSIFDTIHDLVTIIMPFAIIISFVFNVGNSMIAFEFAILQLSLLSFDMDKGIKHLLFSSLWEIILVILIIVLYLFGYLDEQVIMILSGFGMFLLTISTFIVMREHLMRDEW